MEPINVPAVYFDQVRGLADEIREDFEVILTFPPPGERNKAIQFEAHAITRKLVHKFLTDKLGFQVTDGLLQQMEPINVPAVYFDQVRGLADEIREDLEVILTFPPPGERNKAIQFEAHAITRKLVHKFLTDKLGFQVTDGLPPQVDDDDDIDSGEPINVPAAHFDTVRGLVEKVLDTYTVTLMVPPPGKAIRFKAENMHHRKLVNGFLTRKLGFQVDDGLPLQVVVLPEASAGTGTPGTPLNIPVEMFGQVRALLVKIVQDIPREKLRIDVPADPVPVGAYITISGLKGHTRHAIDQLTEMLGISVVSVVSVNKFVLNVGSSTFDALRAHVYTVAEEFGVTLKVPDVANGSSLADKVSIDGDDPSVNRALEHLRKTLALPIHHEKVPSAMGVDQIVIFHDGENLHCGGKIDAEKIYKEMIRGIRTTAGFSESGEPPIPVDWRMYIPREEPEGGSGFYPSSSTTSTLQTQGVLVVSTTSKKGDVDVQMTSGIDKYLTDLVRQVEDSGGNVKIVSRKRLIVIASGDRDFSRPLKNARDLEFRTMIVHHGQLSSGYSTHAEFVWGGWAHVRQLAGPRSGPKMGDSPISSRSASPPKSPKPSKPAGVKWWSLTIMSDHPNMGNIIGPKGATANQMKEDYGIDLQTHKIGVSGKPLKISGPIDGIKECMVRLKVLAREKEKVGVIASEVEEFKMACMAGGGPQSLKLSQGIDQTQQPKSVGALPATDESGAARELRKWLALQDNERVIDHGLAPFYMTVPARYTQAIQNIGLKSLVRKYPNELMMVHAHGQHSFVCVAGSADAGAIDATDATADMASAPTDTVQLYRTEMETEYFRMYQKFSVLDTDRFRTDDSIRISRMAVGGATDHRGGLELQCSNPATLAALQDAVIAALDRQHERKTAVVLPRTVAVRPIDPSLEAVQSKWRVCIKYLGEAREDAADESALAYASNDVQELAKRSDQVKREILTQLCVFSVVGADEASLTGAREDLFDQEIVSIAPFVGRHDSLAAVYSNDPKVRGKLERNASVTVTPCERNSVSDSGGGGVRPTGGQFKKTKLCENWLKTRTCKFGTSCNYAHGKHELHNTLMTLNSLPSSASADSKVARELRIWLLNQPSREVWSHQLQPFYYTITNELKEAMKSDGPRKLIETYKDELLYVEMPGMHFKIQPIPMRLPSQMMATTTTTAAAATKQVLTDMYITGRPNNVAHAMDALTVRRYNVVTDHPLPKHIFAGKALVEALFAETIKFLTDADLPIPIKVRLESNGVLLKPKDTIELGDKITCFLFVADPKCPIFSEAETVEASCIDLENKLRSMIESFVTDRVELTDAIAEQADPAWCLALKSSHDLIGVSVSTREGSRESLKDKWHLTIPLNHKKIGRIIGDKGCQIKKLEETYGVKIYTAAKGSGTDSPLPISGPVDGIAKCMEELSSKSLINEHVDIVHAERAKFKACCDSSSAKAILNLWGDKTRVAGAQKEVQARNDGHRPTSIGVPWLDEPSFLSRLVRDDTDAHSDLTVFAQSRKDVKLKWGGNQFVQISGKEDAVEKCRIDAVELLDNFKRRVVYRRLTFMGVERAFVTANSFDVVSYSCRKAKKDHGYTVLHVKDSVKDSRRASMIDAAEAGSRRSMTPTDRDTDASGVKHLFTVRVKTSGVLIEVMHGDIMDASIGVTSIVNAANHNLDHGGGIALAIARRAGSGELAAECTAALAQYADDEGKSLEAGGCVVTSSCQLAQTSSITHIAHAVAPIFKGAAPLVGQYKPSPSVVTATLNLLDAQYKQAITNALVQVKKLGIDSIAIPLLGSGLFDWPSDRAARLMAEVVSDFVVKNQGGSLRRVVLIDFEADKADALVVAVTNATQNEPPLANAATAAAAASSAPMTRTVPLHQWEWSDNKAALTDSGPWIKYDPDQNVQLEGLWYECQDDPTCNPVVRIAGDILEQMSKGTVAPGDTKARYDVDVVAMVQFNVATKFKRRIKRGADPIGKIQHGKPPPPLVSSSPPPAVQAPVARARKLFEVVNKAVVIRPAAPAETAAAPAPAAVAPRPVEEQPSSSDGSDNDGSVLLYALNEKSLNWVAKEIWDFVNSSWKTSKSMLETPCNTGVPFDYFMDAARKAVETYGGDLIEVDRSKFQFKAKVLGDDSKLLAAERDIILEMSKSQSEFIKERDAPPKTWEDQDNDVETFPVDAKSDEYVEVVEKFTQQPGGVPFKANIIAVERVQNVDLWAGYVHQRRVVADKNNGNANEIRHLKHGTGSTPPERIYTSEAGIDDRYGDKGMYGRGAYFAELATYSHSGYRHNTKDGKCQMFICRVIAGKVQERDYYLEAAKTMAIVHPDPGYHSVHGPVRDGAPGGGRFTAYILYDKHRCYPEYLVTYTV